MGMQRFRAQQIWNRPMDVTIANMRFRTITASGTVGVEFMAKLFPSSGRQVVLNGRVKRSFKVDTDRQLLGQNAKGAAHRVRHLPRDDLKILLQGHADAGATDNDVDGLR